MKKIITIFLLILLTAGCSNKEYKNPTVKMEIENYGTLEIELYPKYAPNTVANFVNLIEEGFYDGLTFHRLVPGFVLQGGDPNGDGTGGPNYTIKGEFKENNYSKNTLSHDTGVISMARSMNYDSAGSQFFIVLDDNENVKASLDGKYAGFVKVTSGLEILSEIEKNEQIENEETGKLKKNITIKKVSVETYGKKYKVKKNKTN